MQVVKDITNIHPPPKINHPYKKKLPPPTKNVLLLFKTKIKGRGRLNAFPTSSFPQMPLEACWGAKAAND